MAKCIACGTETALHVNQQPLCPSCDDQRNTPAKFRVSPAPSNQTEGFQPQLSSFTVKAG
jgi:hypothetical protein